MPIILLGRLFLKVWVMSKFSSWFKGVRGWLLAINFISLFSILAVMLIGYKTSCGLENALHTAYEDRAPRLVLFGDMQSSLNYSALLFYSALSINKDEEKRSLLLDSMKAASDYEGYMTSFLKLKKSEKAQKICDEELSPYSKNYLNLIRQTLGPDKKIVSLDESALGQIQKQILQLTNTLMTLKTNSIENNKLKTAEAYKESTSSIEWLISVGLVFTVINSIFVILIASSLSTKLYKNSQSLDSNAESISVAIEKIENMSDDLSSSSQRQSLALAQTASAINQITAMVSKTTDTVNTGVKLSQTSKNKTENGQAVVKNMLNSMDKISSSNNLVEKTINDSNARISEIIKLIQEIGSKTKIINEIVFQTKLLSFNASVEAARAGEAGKGFSVVAEEVGKLAKVSGEAAQEITNMLNSSIRHVTEVIDETKLKINSVLSDSQVLVKDGVDVSKKCEDVFFELSKDIVDVSDFLNDIAESSAEQMKGVGDISNAIGEISLSNEENTKSVNQSVEAVAQLKVQINLLSDTSLQLSSIVDGKKAVNGRVANEFDVDNIGSNEKDENTKILKVS